MTMNINAAPETISRSPVSITPGYMSGFGNSFETEALPGALPVGRNSPQRCAYGLYAEQLSGSPFTAPRGSNERSWLYRIRPSVRHSGRFAKVDEKLWRTAPCHEVELPIAQLRWDPAPIPTEDMTFLQGVRTLTTAGDAHTQAGMGAPTSAKITAAPSRCRSAARSAPIAWPMRAISSPRSRPMRTRTRRPNCS